MLQNLTCTNFGVHFASLCILSRLKRCNQLSHWRRGRFLSLPTPFHINTPRFHLNSSARTELSLSSAAELQPFIFLGLISNGHGIDFDRPFKQPKDLRKAQRQHSDAIDVLLQQVEATIRFR